MEVIQQEIQNISYVVDEELTTFHTTSEQIYYIQWIARTSIHYISQNKIC